jgi:hypothetical protein
MCSHTLSGSNTFDANLFDAMSVAQILLSMRWADDMSLSFRAYCYGSVEVLMLVMSMIP